MVVGFELGFKNVSKFTFTSHSKVHFKCITTAKVSIVF